jgi:2'-5' RNA ligase
LIRLFAAIEIPEPVRTRLGFLQGGIPGARWSKPENLHLTLRFIGEVNEATARDIDSLLTGIRAPSFELTLKGAGEFGGKEPHAVWAGVKPNPALTHLASKIESALQRMGLPADTRKYTPHVTLAYLHDAPVAKVREFVLAHDPFECGPFAATWFGLYSSHSSSGGSHYVLESQYALLPRDQST